MPLLWFAPPLQDLWRASIAWTFLLVAGCMYPRSRSNLRRAARYLGVALVIFIATSLVAVDVPVSFGIMYCMGACTLVATALDRCSLLPRGPAATVALIVAFLLLLPLPTGQLGFGPLRLMLPQGLYATPWLSWLGLPGPGFASGDYYPLLPFVLMYLAGASVGTCWHERGTPHWLEALSCPWLEFVGRHALEVYVAHQPILLMLVLPLTS